MNKIFFTSDNHYEHKNIVKFTGRPENHNQVMISKNNAVVGKNDVVYNLGDFAFCSLENQKIYFDALNGTKVLIRGNHDGGISRMEEIGFIVPERYLGESPFVLHYGNVILILTHAPMKTSELNTYQRENCSVINIHGHVHQNGIQSKIVEERDSIYVDEKFKEHVYYYNVSVEVTDLAPVRFETIMDALKEPEKFGRGNKYGILN